MVPHAELYQNGDVSKNGISPAPLHNHMNGNSDTRQHRSRLIRGSDAEAFDLICVGFGPSNLALAIALHDRLENAAGNSSSELSDENQKERLPKVLFLERNREYSWHAGMQMPSVHMQITFLKDLATQRNPRSEFTFINYLHYKHRLLEFANLGTFLPERIEYEDYMRWCAGWFDDVVEYGQEVVGFQQQLSPSHKLPVKVFTVQSRSVHTGSLKSYSARNVVVAIGGRPRIPRALPQGHALVLHSSTYATAIDSILPDKAGSHHFVIIGGGQSSAEIFNDLHSRYPNARTTLIVRGSSLRPSDDSPFVNEIFDPKRVNSFYNRSKTYREASIAEDRPTNYSVVRLDLLEHLYAQMYRQRVFEPDETKWQHRILTNTTVVEAEPTGKTIQLLVRNAQDNSSCEEILNASLVIAGTGYVHDGHVPMMQPLQNLNLHQDGNWSIARDYKVHFRPGAVDKSAAIFLQGSNEATHGLSDTLLSILACRAGELVESIFGESF